MYFQAYYYIYLLCTAAKQKDTLDIEEPKNFWDKFNTFLFEGKRMNVDHNYAEAILSKEIKYNSEICESIYYTIYYDVLGA